MSEEIVTNLPVLAEASNEELAVALGFKQNFQGPLLPTLRVNYEDEDQDENPIKRGDWSINYEGTPVYAKEVVVRLMFSRFQYSHYDLTEGKTICTSVFFENFGDEIPDTCGGFKCGKLTRKEQADISPSEKELQRKIKLSRVMFVLATMNGKDAKGNKVTVEDYPCIFHARGTHYMPVGDYIDELVRLGNLPMAVLTKFSTKRKKNEGVTFWEVVPENSGDVPFTADDYKIVKDFAALVESENIRIMDEFVQKHDKRKESEAPLSADFKVVDVSVEPAKDEFPDTLEGVGDGPGGTLVAG